MSVVDKAPAPVVAGGGERADELMRVVDGGWGTSTVRDAAHAVQRLGQQHGWHALAVSCLLSYQCVLRRRRR
jgi:hypothetical protein